MLNFRDAGLASGAAQHTARFGNTGNLHFHHICAIFFWEHSVLSLLLSRRQTFASKESLIYKLSLKINYEDYSDCINDDIATGLSTVDAPVTVSRETN